MVIRAEPKQVHTATPLHSGTEACVIEDNSTLQSSATACLEDTCNLSCKVPSTSEPAEARHVFNRYDLYDGGASVETQSVISDNTSPTRGWSSGEDLPANPDMDGVENPDLEALGDLSWSISDASAGWQNFSDVDRTALNDVSSCLPNPRRADDFAQNNSSSSSANANLEPSSSDDVPAWVSKLLDRAHQGDAAVKQAFFWIPQEKGSARKPDVPKSPSKGSATGGAALPARPKPRSRSWDAVVGVSEPKINIPRRAASRVHPRGRHPDLSLEWLRPRIGEASRAAEVTGRQRKCNSAEVFEFLTTEAEASQPQPHSNSDAKASQSQPHAHSARPSARQVRQPPGISRALAPPVAIPTATQQLSSTGGDKPMLNLSEYLFDPARHLQAVLHNGPSSGAQGAASHPIPDEDEARQLSKLYRFQ